VGIFVGPDVVADKVIATGDLLDGLPVADLRFCDEGLNDSGQLAFQVTFDDPTVPDGRRIAIYRATCVGGVTRARAGEPRRQGRERTPQ